MGLKVVCVTLLLLEAHQGLFLPQSQTDGLDYDEIYGDYDPDNAPLSSPGPDLGDIIQVGGALAKTLGDLLSQKVNFFRQLLSNQELQTSIHRSLGAGLNLTGEVLKVAVPTIGKAVGTVLAGSSEAASATRRIVNNPQVQNQVVNVASAGGNVVRSLGQVAAEVPRVLGEGSRFVGSVVAAANETAPLVVEGFQDFQEQIPLITGFAQAYAEVNAEQAQLVSRTFRNSLECNLECGDLRKGSSARAECEAVHCIPVEASDDF